MDWLKRLLFGPEPQPEFDMAEHMISVDRDWIERDRKRLRDHFAGQALASINVFELVGLGDAEVAERVYDLAEAMMAERERRQ